MQKWSRKFTEKEQEQKQELWKTKDGELLPKSKTGPQKETVSILVAEGPGDICLVRFQNCYELVIIMCHKYSLIF